MFILQPHSSSLIIIVLLIIIVKNIKQRIGGLHEKVYRVTSREEREFTGGMLMLEQKVDKI